MTLKEYVDSKGSGGKVKVGGDIFELVSAEHITANLYKATLEGGTVVTLSQEHEVSLPKVKDGQKRGSD